MLPKQTGEPMKPANKKGSQLARVKLRHQSQSRWTPNKIVGKGEIEAANKNMLMSTVVNPMISDLANGNFFLALININESQIENLGNPSANPEVKRGQPKKTTPH